MNTKNKNIVPVTFGLAFLFLLAILFLTIKPKYDEYNETKIRNSKFSVEQEGLESKIQQIENEQKQEQIKLEALKTVYQSEVSSYNENLGMFGDMFDELIKTAQKNSLLIRSIEYDMRPAEDPIYNENSDTYNVCELKFNFVGTYSQFQSFLFDINNNFKYLVSISNVNVTAFSGNTDYLLINTSITLYSKKPESEITANQKSKRKTK